MKRKQTATLDELTEAFAEDPQLPFDMDAHRARKAEVQQSKIQAHLEERRAYDALRDLSARCKFCGLTVSGRDTNPGTESAHKFVGHGKGLGRLQTSMCRPCYQRYNKHHNAVTFEGEYAVVPEAAGLYDRIEAEGLLRYWPTVGDNRDPDSAVIPLAWASWAFRARLAGMEDPGDPAKPFSHLLEVKPENLDWHPQIPVSDN